MTQTSRKLTFDKYLHLDVEAWVRLGLPEGACEFVDGELIELPPESGINDDIANFLFLQLVNAGVDLSLVKPHTCELEVPIVQIKDPRTRYPDLVLLKDEHLPLITKRLTIRLHMPAPELVVEVVSPGRTNRERDYERKRNQYQKREIPEFWLIDPQAQTLKVLTLEGDRYVEVGTFRGTDAIDSPTLKRLTLELTADQLL